MSGKGSKDQARLDEVEANKQRTLASGLKPGPSGMPVQHFIQASSRAEARDIAQTLGHGHKPEHDTAHQPGQKPHYHLTTATGTRDDKNSPHVLYSQKNSSLPSPKLNRKNL